MKKVLVYVIAAVLAFGLLSCNGKQEKAENLEDLKKKYEGKEFKNCDDFIEAAEEMIDVFIAIIDRAADGDEGALEEIDAMEEFMNQFEKQAEKFEEECPEKYLEFENRAEEKMAESLDKLMDILLGGMDWDMDWEYDEDFEWDEDIDMEEEAVEYLKG